MVDFCFTTRSWRFERCFPDFRKVNSTQNMLSDRTKSHSRALTTSFCKLAHTLIKIQVNLPEKAPEFTCIVQANFSHLTYTWTYPKFTWKFEASLSEFLPELAWKSHAKYTWEFQVVFLVQVFLPEFHLKISGF